MQWETIYFSSKLLTWDSKNVVVLDSVTVTEEVSDDPRNTS